MYKVAFLFSCDFENFWLNCGLWLLLFHQHPLFGGVGVLDPAKVFCSSFYHLACPAIVPFVLALTNAHIAGASAINFLRAVEFLSLSVIFPFFFIPSSYLICICDSCKINGHIYTIQQIYDQSHACFNIRNTVHKCKEIFAFSKSLLCILKKKMLQNYLNGIYFSHYIVLEKVYANQIIY